MKKDSTSRVLALVSSRWEWMLAIALALAACFVFTNFGMAWDDAQHAVYGSYVLDYFLSGFRDMRWQTDIGGLYYYGTIFDMPSAALHRWFGVDLFQWRALLMAFTGILAIPAVAGIGRFVGGNRTAAFSVAALLLMPQFVGQSFINCKDIPLASAVAWSVLAILRITSDVGWRSFLFCGLMFGITLSVRIGGILVLVYAFALVGFLVLRSLVNKKLPGDLKWCLGKNLHWIALGALLVTWILTVSLWPYAHQNPFLNLLKSFQQSAAFPQPYPVLYVGQVFESTELPWHYLPLMLILTMPLPIVLLAGSGLFVSIWRFLRGWQEEHAERLFLVLFWIAFPIAYVIVKQPNIYDGVRHFLFVLPALAVMAGVGAGALSDAINRFLRPLGVAAPCLLLACAAPALFKMHPYQYAFYNALAGDKETLHERFETDYWITSYREAATILNRQQMLATRPLHVAVGANALSISCFSQFADPRLKIAFFLGSTDDSPFPTDMDFTVAVPRYGMWRNFPNAAVAADIRRDGILMCVIRSRDGKTAP